MLKLLPNINLTDENNETSRFHDLIKNHTVILNMFYSNCQIKCQPLGNLLKKVNLLLNSYLVNGDNNNSNDKTNIVFISITLDAMNDTVKDLNRFKKLIWDERCANWHFYTGNYEEIETLRYKLGMYSPEKEIDQVKSNHTGGFLIFNPSIGFSKHTEAFDNPIDISRKVIQLIPRNFITHSYNLDDLKYEWLTETELFENIKSINSMFTIPFIPKQIIDKYEIYAEKQRGFNYKPPINNNNNNNNLNLEKHICCCNK